MIKRKIAFVISSNEIGNWSGGISYFRNLFEIIKSEKKYKIIIYTDSKNFIKKQKLEKYFDVRNKFS